MHINLRIQDFNYNVIILFYLLLFGIPKMLKFSYNFLLNENIHTTIFKFNIILHLLTTTTRYYGKNRQTITYSWQLHIKNNRFFYYFSNAKSLKHNPAYFD